MREWIVGAGYSGRGEQATTSNASPRSYNAAETLLAFKVRREIFREARFFGMTPLDAVLARDEIAAFKVVFVNSTFFSESAACTFLTTVFIAESADLFRAFLFSD